MYFIASGKCIVEQKDIISAKIINNKIASLSQGDYFGVSILLLVLKICRKWHYCTTARGRGRCIRRTTQL